MSNAYCGKCCKDMRLPLSGKDVERLELVGTRLVQLLSVLPESTTWNSPQGLQALETAKSNSVDPEDPNWQLVYEMVPQMEPGEGLFDMEGSCGNLQADGSCGDYENRPRICQEFRTGSRFCQPLAARALQEYEQSVEVSIGRRIANQLKTLY